MPFVFLKKSLKLNFYEREVKEDSVIIHCLGYPSTMEYQHLPEQIQRK